MATYGVVSTVCVVYLHHVQVAVHVRNWTWWLLMWLGLSLLGLPITCFLAQLGPYTPLRNAIYGQLLTSLQLDATILLIVGGLSVPIIIHKFVHELWLWPKFYTSD